jgi:hypothetical protein
MPFWVDLTKQILLMIGTNGEEDGKAHRQGFQSLSTLIKTNVKLITAGSKHTMWTQASAGSGS